MLMRVGLVDVNLESGKEVIQDAWHHHFGSLPQQHNHPEHATAAVGLHLDLKETLSLPASARPLYRDNREILDVYRGAQEDAVLLHFRSGALVHIGAGNPREAHGVVTPPIFRHGQLEDVTYTSLAPLLRRHSCYLLHAAAVTTSKGAVLLVGPSGSGKTTTALALLLSGCKHLASDVVALAQVGESIAAFPTAGLPRVRAHSFDLLPGLSDMVKTNGDPHKTNTTGVVIAPELWDTATPVKAIYFPVVSGSRRTVLEELAPSVALAQLMEESVDRWDERSLVQHIDFLTRLSKQARHFSVKLAPDVQRLPNLISAA